MLSGLSIAFRSSDGAAHNRNYMAHAILEHAKGNDITAAARELGHVCVFAHSVAGETAYGALIAGIETSDISEAIRVLVRECQMPRDNTAWYNAYARDSLIKILEACDCTHDDIQSVFAKPALEYPGRLEGLVMTRVHSFRNSRAAKVVSTPLEGVRSQPKICL